MEKIENKPPADRRVEGISMSHYSGSLSESWELFLDQARLFVKTKNMDYAHEGYRKRVLAIMVSNLTGQAAAWYVTQQHEIADITALTAALRREFIQPDLQERLRDSLNQLKQRECRNLAEYITKYRQLISRADNNCGGFGNQMAEEGADRFHQLLVKSRTVNGRCVKVLLDSGAGHNVIRKGLATPVVRRKKAVEERFDGSVTSPQWLNKVQADMTLEGFVLNDTFFSEWDSPVTHDIVLGKPWFSRFNTVIDWRTHEVRLDLGLLDPFWLIEEDGRLFQLGEGIESAGRTVCSDGDAKPAAPDDGGASGRGIGLAGTPVGTLGQATKLPSSPITRLLQDYTDCFPDALPNELLVSRAMELGLTMTPGARPSTRAPFRLSKTEQEALKRFVEGLLEKKWIETSDSPWVSSIFAVPKKDPVTEKAPSKAEWILSDTASLPVRWVMDYRYMNSQTGVPKIPLPRIEELFDQMVGCRLFSTLDLGQGYHQMRVELASRNMMFMDMDGHASQSFHASEGGVTASTGPKLPDYTKRFLLTTDTSGFCCGAVLSQNHAGEDHPVAFISKKFSRREINWPTHEKGLFAINLALGKWRHYLHGRLFDVFTDNSACKWFLSHPNSSGILARWLNFFLQFSFVLHHVKGSTNAVADALSRVAKTAFEDTPVETASISVLLPSQTSEIKLHGCAEACLGTASGLRQLGNTILALGELSLRDLDLLCGGSHFSGGGSSVAGPIGVPQAVARLKASQLTIVTVQIDTKLLFLCGYRRDPLYRELIKHSAPKTQNIANLGMLQKENGMIYRADAGKRVQRLCVPADQTLSTTLIADAYDGAEAAHSGIHRTQQKLSFWFFWPSMEADVKAYVQSCPTCARFKSSSLRKNGRLMPLPVPSECWEVVGMDFVTGCRCPKAMTPLWWLSTCSAKEHVPRPNYHPLRSIQGVWHDLQLVPPFPATTKRRMLPRDVSGSSPKRHKTCLMAKNDSASSITGSAAPLNSVKETWCTWLLRTCHWLTQQQEPAWKRTSLLRSMSAVQDHENGEQERASPGIAPTHESST
ncbi:unnamed protein product [Phytophthora fragariaefolia]|uniref:RNA-directed DNA polymerase n=1 Tax=Phytophthora fragariaefolia TaxID=1490495 RepID=A0A9W6U3G4_9STRA|nr:unnamed protein product [Phytophthora fragariaefolia]